MSSSIFSNLSSFGSSSSTAPTKPFTLESFWLPISPRAQRHLVKVYATLCLTLVAASIGAAFHVYYHIGGMLTHILSFILLALIAADGSQSSYTTPYNGNRFWTRRVSLLCAFGLVQGCSIGPLIDMALYIDPSAIFMALVLTANVFICFTLTALYIPRRSMFTFASLLSSSLSFLLLISIFSLFWPNIWLYKIQLYVGLLVFCAYLLFDTQVIIERAEDGRTSGDVYVDDALSLFTNMIAIFVRILIILLQNTQQQNEQQRKQTKRR